MSRKLDPNDIADMQVAHKIQTIVEIVKSL